MAYSIQLYTGDGSQKLFTFDFAYLDQDHVFVKVDGVNVPFTFSNSNMVSINTTPPVGSIIEIYRITPKDRLVDFLNGSIQDAEDFDLDSNQLLYLVLEGLDEFTKSLSRVPVDRDNTMYVNVDMNGEYKIVNSAAPTDPTDLVRVTDLRTFIREEALGYIVSEANPGDTITVELALELLDTYLSYVSQNFSDAVDEAKAYADLVSNAVRQDLQPQIDDVVADVVSNSNAITALSGDVANNAADIDSIESTLTTLATKTYVDSADAANNSYADTVGANTLASANAYADSLLSGTGGLNVVGRIAFYFDRIVVGTSIYYRVTTVYDNFNVSSIQWSDGSNATTTSKFESFLEGGLTFNLTNSASNDDLIFASNKLDSGYTSFKNGGTLIDPQSKSSSSVAYPVTVSESDMWHYVTIYSVGGSV